MCPLGMLYRPSGLALETAQAVLETTVENTFACNLGFGCSNACLYCFVPRFTRRRRDACEVRLPQKPPVDLVRHQLEHQWRFHFAKGHEEIGVFLSFLTDPFLPKISWETENLLEMLLLEYGFTTATLSKLGCSPLRGIRHGMTLVSLDDAFWRQFEPNTTSPLTRLGVLKTLEREDEYAWVSMEPYPTSAIYKQRIEDLLEEFNFVDLIVFGKWNYSKLASTEQARKEYAENVQVLTDFCKSNNIRLHVKSDTLKFIAKEK